MNGLGMNNKRKLVIRRCRGFGQEAVWVARNIGGYEILGYCDDNLDLKGEVIYGARVLDTSEAADRNFTEKPYFVCSIAKNEVRKRVVETDSGSGWLPATWSIRR